MDNKKHIVNLESFRDMLHICLRLLGQSFVEPPFEEEILAFLFRDMLHICLRLPGQSFVEPPFEEEILAFLRFLGHSGAIRKLTDEDFVYQVEHKDTKKSNEMYYPRFTKEDFVYQVEHKDTKKSNEMYYPRFTKVIIHHFMSKDPSIPRRNKTRSSSDTTTPPPTAAASPRLTISEKGKQATKSSKAKSLSALSEVAMTEAQKLKIVTKKSLQQTHISQASGSGIDEGTGTLQGVLDVPKTRSSSDTTTPPPTAAASPRLTISEKGKQATKSSKAKSLSALSEVAMTEAQKLKIVTKKSLQQTHISQASGSGIDEGTDEGDDEEDDEEEVGDDEQVSDEEEFIHPSLSTHAKEDTRDEEIQQAPLPPTTAPSTLLQDLPNFGSLFGFDNRLKTLEANFSEFMKTNQFAGAVSSIPGIVQRYMDQWMNEAVKVAVQIQSDRLHDEAQKENDDFSRLLWSLSFPSHIDHRK
nr:hypothetical protein [Tanacetum cinerariifolium]